LLIPLEEHGSIKREPAVMIVIFAVQTGFVAAVLAWLAVLRPASKTRALLLIAAAALALTGACLVGIWLYPPLWAAALLAGSGFAAIAIGVWARAGALGSNGIGQRLLQGAGVLAWAGIGGVLIWHGLTGRMTPAESFDLAAPLQRGGGYCAISGGASPLLNFHMETLAPGKESYRGQSYGVDFIARSPLGLRTTDAYALHAAPGSPGAYRIFGAAVRSPCAGEVVAAYDGMVDQPAGVINRTMMAGNHVMLRCEGYDVLLAHLRHGSVAVSRGQRVERGTPLGQVGNTGASDEPHLHLSAQRAVDPQPSFSGGPVHITFDGAFIARGACL
jgi:murein DD-endopeptidase MepM/ murein hydrolase activator NlpD